MRSMKEKKVTRGRKETMRRAKETTTKKIRVMREAKRIMTGR